MHINHRRKNKHKSYVCWRGSHEFRIQKERSYRRSTDKQEMYDHPSQFGSVKRYIAWY